MAEKQLSSFLTEERPLHMLLHSAVSTHQLKLNPATFQNFDFQTFVVTPLGQRRASLCASSKNPSPLIS
jgi:hypothetical protein